MNIDDFDFLALKNVLVEKLSKPKCNRYDIRKCIDTECVRQGFYDVPYSVDQYNYKKEHGTTDWNWIRNNPKFKLIENIFEIIEEAGMIEFVGTELKADRWKVHYYRVIEDRNELEIIKDMIPEASNAEAMMVFKLLKTSNVSKAVRIFKEFKESLVYK